MSCSLIFNTVGTPHSYLKGQGEREHIIQFWLQ